MRNYILEGTTLEIDMEISSLIKKYKFNGITSSYDMENMDALSNTLEDLETISLFGDDKVIVLKNINLLNNNDKAYNHLLRYLNNESNNLFIMTSNKIDSRLTVFKELKKLVEYKKIETDILEFIKNRLGKYKMEKNTMEFFVDYCNNNITKISSEIDKLKNFVSSYNITKEDILAICVREFGDATSKTFEFIRSLGERNKKKALEEYIELLNYNFVPQVLLSAISTNFRNMMQYKLLEDRSYSIKDIGETLFSNSKYSLFRAQKIKELADGFSILEIRLVLEMISNIDRRNKTMSVSLEEEIKDLIINI